ncbi:MAG: putative DsbA family dithiol-disulfide isomerase [Bermanella sp.]|jgi:predicted DsbA family dithiol-disulfide isomerase
MLQVDYFSDVLCIWAFINEKRLEEVELQLGSGLEINLQFLPNFASVYPKITTTWKDRGGFNGYAEHVTEVAEQFDFKLHADTWTKVQPTTSMVAHSFIKAVQSVHGHHKAREYSLAIRKAFFLEAKDISQVSVCDLIAVECDVNNDAIDEYMDSGQALSDLNWDFQQAKDYQISVSPAWVFNEGRQKLIGNVGYGVIEANLKELMIEKPLKHNWC